MRGEGSGIVGLPGAGRFGAYYSLSFHRAGMPCSKDYLWACAGYISEAHDGHSPLRVRDKDPPEQRRATTGQAPALLFTSRLKNQAFSIGPAFISMGKREGHVHVALRCGAGAHVQL